MLQHVEELQAEQDNGGNACVTSPPGGGGDNGGVDLGNVEVSVFKEDEAVVSQWATAAAAALLS